MFGIVGIFRFKLRFCANMWCYWNWHWCFLTIHIFEVLKPGCSRSSRAGRTRLGFWVANVWTWCAAVESSAWLCMPLAWVKLVTTRAKWQLCCAKVSLNRLVTSFHQLSMQLRYQGQKAPVKQSRPHLNFGSWKRGVLWPLLWETSI